MHNNVLPKNVKKINFDTLCVQCKISVFQYEMHICKKMVLVAVKCSHMYKTLYCVVIKWSCVDGKT